MKNTEWGVISYLSISNYGQGQNRIWNNNANDYTTGCDGDSATAEYYNGCQHTYETVNGVKASTTGNIYGIYDISGGAVEQMAAYVNNGDWNVTTNGWQIIYADPKYRDVYVPGTPEGRKNNYDLMINQKGSALYETSNVESEEWWSNSTSWFTEQSVTPSGVAPWFIRGGLFGFDQIWGPVNGVGFRPILVVGKDL